MTERKQRPPALIGWAAFFCSDAGCSCEHRGWCCTGCKELVRLLAAIIISKLNEKTCRWSGLWEAFCFTSRRPFTRCDAIWVQFERQMFGASVKFLLRTRPERFLCLPISGWCRPSTGTLTVRRSSLFLWDSERLSRISKGCTCTERERARGQRTNTQPLWSHYVLEAAELHQTRSGRILKKKKPEWTEKP